MNLPQNIDLTETRRFQKREIDVQPNDRRIPSIDYINVLLKRDRGFPWRKVEKIPHDPYSTIIPTGYAEDIKQKEFYHKADIGESCYCCGLDLTKFPWKKSFTLCYWCNRKMELSQSNTYYLRHL
ncbi:hypothetical protein [Virgibacillus salexigens]|uniref:Uncharacterized protein n=1 Tax=Virgibacillus massiliensis TaxID=1462526 RepID=A0A024QBF2_9BACI|nr:hypothetical protein [Virgibacillus massiliensis]CDQ39505.1 hypothetical protein BN990_01810 [Virgibacillus massiliensis]